MEPLRRCVACRNSKPRRQLWRIMHCRTRAQVLLFGPGETDSKLFGRSVYFCAASDCIRQAVKGRRLYKALKTTIPDDILRTFLSADGTVKKNDVV